MSYDGTTTGSGSQRTYREIAEDYSLWCENAGKGGVESEAEFDAMSTSEKIAMLVNMFGLEENPSGEEILSLYGIQDDHIPWAAGSSKSTIAAALSQVMDCDESDADEIRDAARSRLADAVGSAAYAIRIDAGDTRDQAEAASDEGEILEWLVGGDLMDIAAITTLAEAATKLATEYLADENWSPRTAAAPAKLPTLTCLRCGRTWHPQRDGRPKVCPECKSYSWDKPRRTPKA